MPFESVIYVADQAHVPYGPRTLEQVRRFSESIARFLLESGARLIVVACNSASAAALAQLRVTFPDVPFVGMEPAVKPAAESTHTRVVGVLATPATFQGALYASVVERFAAGVTLLRDTCPGLVEQIEAGDLTGPETRRILEHALKPMLSQGIDTVVLACTHFPFVIPLIQEIVGEKVRVIDPAPSVARQTLRLLDAASARGRGGGPGQVEYFTSGDTAALERMLKQLLGLDAHAVGLEWVDETRLIRQGASAAIKGSAAATGAKD
jgi:glutamate racemase